MHPEIFGWTERRIAALGGAGRHVPGSDLLAVNEEFVASIMLARCKRLPSGSAPWNALLDNLDRRYAMAPARPHMEIFEPCGGVPPCGTTEEAPPPLPLYEFNPSRPKREQWLVEELGATLDAGSVAVMVGARKSGKFHSANPAGKVPAGDLVGADTGGIATPGLNPDVPQDRPTDATHQRGGICLATFAGHIRHPTRNRDEVEGEVTCRPAMLDFPALENLHDLRGQAIHRTEFAALSGKPALFAVQQLGEPRPTQLLHHRHVHHSGQRLAPVLDLRSRGDVGRQLLRFAAHQGDRDRILVGKVLIQRADADTGPLGDGVGRIRIEASLLQNASRRLDDVLHRLRRARLQCLFPGL